MSLGSHLILRKEGASVVGGRAKSEHRMRSPTQACFLAQKTPLGLEAAVREMGAGIQRRVRIKPHELFLQKFP